MNTLDGLPDTKMSQFTNQTLWTAEPKSAAFDVSAMIWGEAQLSQLATAMADASPALQVKLDAFRSISLSEAAAFSRVR